MSEIHLQCILGIEFFITIPMQNDARKVERPPYGSLSSSPYMGQINS